MVQKIQPETFELLRNIGKNGKVQTSCIKSFLQLWEADFQNYQSSHRQEIQRLIGEYPFRNGILLSSKDLYDQLDDFAEILPSVNKDSERIEFSVLRYLTRMAYKTSTFQYVHLFRPYKSCSQ